MARSRLTMPLQKFLPDTSPPKIPVLVIMGPTGSGKSAWAMEIARRFNGEIVTADSRQIYRGMDIGTAKPSTEDRAEIPHHLIDILTPDKSFTVADYVPLAQAAIEDIHRRGRLPILVGGTGLYVRALLHGYRFGSALPHPEWRAEMEQKPLPEILEQLDQLSPSVGAEVDRANPRRVIRALENALFGNAKMGQAVPSQSNLCPFIIAPIVSPAILRDRIEQRLDLMLEAGLSQEVSALVNLYGWDAPGLNTIGYQEWRPYMDSRAARLSTLGETRQTILYATRAYARRQRIWLRKEKNIHWLESLDEALTSQPIRNMIARCP